jgi:quinol monooxygenase YgiN
MSGHVFVVSEWLPKKNHDEEFFKAVKKLMALTLEKESGCLRAHATRQISHPGSPGESKFTIVLLQEYINIQAFDLHCAAEYVKDCFKKYIENKDTAIVEDWRCRLFSEG